MKYHNWNPKGFWGCGENVYFFLKSLGTLVKILGDLGNRLKVLGI